MVDVLSKSLNTVLEWTDSALKKAARKLRPLPAAPATPTYSSEPPITRHGQSDKIHQITFTFAVIALSAKLAAVDGKIKQEEFEAFCVLFPMPEEEQPKIQRLFFMASSDPNNFMHYVRQIIGVFPGRPALMEDLIQRLCRLAESDGRVCIAERRMLADIAKALKVDQFVVDDALRTVFDSSSPKDPFELLGVLPTISNDGLKQAYRRRVRELHPDKLAGEGYQEEDIANAKAELLAVNEAYMILCRKRKIK